MSNLRSGTVRVVEKTTVMRLDCVRVLVEICVKRHRLVLYIACQTKQFLLKCDEQFVNERKKRDREEWGRLAIF